MDLPEVHEEALASTRAVVAGVKDDQWNDPTPCEGWTVRELVNHIVAGNCWVMPLVSGKTIDEVGDRLDGDILGDDPLAAYEESAGEASAAFKAPGAMSAPCAVSYGPVPGEVYAGHRFCDVLIHGWDLAKATGQDTRLDSGLVQACWDVMSPQAPLLKASGMCGGDIDASEDADLQTRLLALLGRTPS